LQVSGKTEMESLIIAAGKGERLSSKAESKPLVPLLGIPLIQRVILTASKAGIKEFYVVTGYNSDKLGEFLNNLSQEKNIKIKKIINQEFEKGNGLSVLKGEEYLKDRFLLLMSDHIFDPDILKEIIQMKIAEDEILLAVDEDLNNPFVDLQDVTKVLLNEEKKVVDIGKNILKYNAYDTGIFLCSREIFLAIRKILEKNSHCTLTEAVKLLAEKGKVLSFNINHKFWIDIDDEISLKKAEKYMLKNLRKSTDGPISKYFNRYFSTILTKYLVKTRITPNQISFFSFILSLFASCLFFFSGYLPLAIGGLSIQFCSIIDGCDGEVARLKYLESKFGAWFDAVLDRYADAFILFALTYHSLLPFFNPSYLIIGFFAIIGSFMNSYTADKYDGLMKRYFKSSFRIGRDIRLFLIFLGALLNLPILTLFILAILMNFENIRRIYLASKYSSL
jgi:CDP-L-myo-inositol myo-inositolphosphotransferase